MADPRVTSMKTRATNDLPRRWIIPQDRIVLTNAKTDGDASQNRAQIPFMRYGLVAIHVFTDITKSNNIDFQVATQAGTANTTQLTFTATAVSTTAETVLHCHKETGKSWSYRNNTHQYDNDLQLGYADGYAFSQDNNDGFVPSSNRGVLPVIVLSTTCDGIIDWYVVVDQLSDDL